jgi:hypothetical protein
MAYIPFEADTPVITDTGAEVIDDTRLNLMALRDAVVAGVLKGWDMAATGGTAEEPTQILYSHNTTTEALKLVVTWGTSGGEDGNPKTVVYSYSNDDFGGSDEAMGTWTGTYDASGNLTAETWS